MNCFFCNKPMSGSDSYIEHILSESQWNCTTCDFSIEYAYGSTRIAIGQQEFQWGYRDTEYDINARHTCEEFMNKLKEKGTVGTVELPI